MRYPLPIDHATEKDTSPTPPRYGGQKTAGMCFLSIVLVLVGFASIIAGFVCADEFGTEYLGYGISHKNETAQFLYIAGGILTGLYNFALAVIVDACYKYIKSSKG